MIVFVKPDQQQLQLPEGELRLFADEHPAVGFGVLITHEGGPFAFIPEAEIPAALEAMHSAAGEITAYRADQLQAAYDDLVLWQAGIEPMED